MTSLGRGLLAKGYGLVITVERVPRSALSLLVGVGLVVVKLTLIGALAFIHVDAKPCVNAQGKRSHTGRSKESCGRIFYRCPPIPRPRSLGCP